MIKLDMVHLPGSCDIRYNDTGASGKVRPGLTAMGKAPAPEQQLTSLRTAMTIPLLQHAIPATQGKAMGMDFVALLRYIGPCSALQEAISSLEEDPTAPAMRNVHEHWQRAGFSDFSWNQMRWVATKGEAERCDRPSLPTLDWSLRTREGFFLTFGPDAISVYHLLRWQFFLTDPEWRSNMLAAVAALCRLFRGRNDSMPSARRTWRARGLLPLTPLRSWSLTRKVT